MPCFKKCINCSKLSKPVNQNTLIDYCYNCSVTALPFTHLNDNEFQNTLNEFQFGRSKLGTHSRIDELHTNPFNLYDKYNSTAGQYDQNNLPTNNDKYYLDNEFNHVTSEYLKKSANNFSLLHINARSLNKNFDSLSQLLQSINTNFNVIGITETWLKDPTSLINMNNYNFIHKSRVNKSGGGVGMYILNNIDFKLRDDITSDLTSMESMFIEIDNKERKNTVIGNIYRPPNCDIKKFLNEFELLTSKINKENKNCFLLGDFNINLLNIESNEETNQFLDILYSSCFIPLISQPTRITSHSSTLIDNIFTNVIDIDESLNGLICADISDHLPIFHIHKITGSMKNKKTSNTTLQRCITNQNIKNFTQKIQQTNLCELADKNVNVSYDNLIKRISTIYDSCFPVKKKTTKFSNNKPWITQGILKSIRKKNLLYKKFLKSPCEHNNNKFKYYRNKLNRVIKIAKRNHISNCIEQSKMDCKKTWKIINDLIKKNTCKQSLSSSFIQGDIEISNPNVIANKFASYFTNIGNNLSKAIPATNKNFKSYLDRNFVDSFFMNPTTPDEIKSITLSLKNNNSCGYDNINIKVIKAAIPFLSNPLSEIINNSLKTGIVPDNCKIAKIVPLFKSGDKKLFNNYRPISILPCISKIYEKVVYNRLLAYVNKNNILSKNQYGFRNKHSTATAIVDFNEKLSSAIDSGFYTIGIFLDLAKAFDTINHEILLKKLEHYGIRGVPLKWFESYLTNRKQFVQYYNAKSKLHQINCGVPQGSILGPLLFLLYINDICSSSDKLSFTLFADDTNLFYKSKTLDDLTNITNSELTKISLWLKTNKLSLNVKKTNYILFTNRKKIPYDLTNIKIDNNEIIRVNETKFLGIIIDSHLKWKPQIRYVASKISKNIGIISKLQYFLPKHTLKTLYFTLIYPYLHYGNIIWASNYHNNLRRLNLLQKKVLRIITKSGYLSHTENLFKEQKILTIQKINSLETAILMYKFNCNQLPESFDTIFNLNKNIHCHNTRQSSNYHIPTKNSKLAQFSITYMGPKVWNNFRSIATQSNSLCIFKSKVKNHLLKKGNILI